MERKDCLKRWINKSFKLFQQNEKILSLKELQDPQKLIDMLKEIDFEFFQDISIPIYEAKNIFNQIFKSIRKFYKEVIGKELPENELDHKEFVKFSNEDEFVFLAEILAAMSAQCVNKMHFLDIMQNELQEIDKKELLEVLNERILNDDKEGKDAEEEEEIKKQENENYLRKIDFLENENHNLNEKISLMKLKNEDLASSLLMIEQSYSELEMKYTDMLSQQTLNFDRNRDNHVNDYNQHPSQPLDEMINLSIQVSELNAKLEAKEKLIEKLKFDKEKANLETNRIIQSLRHENEEFRDVKSKYEILKENHEKIKLRLEDFNNLKIQNIQLEKTIKLNEEKLAKFKMIELDKSKLLKRIEELNIILEEEREKNSEIMIERNHYFDKVTSLEAEVNNLKELFQRYKEKIKQTPNSIQTQNSEIKTTNESKETSDESKKNVASLSEIEENLDLNKQIENEKRINILINECENLQKEKFELEEKLLDLQDKHERLITLNDMQKSKLDKNQEIFEKNKEIEKLKKENAKTLEIENKYKIEMMELRKSFMNIEKELKTVRCENKRNEFKLELAREVDQNISFEVNNINNLTKYSFADSKIEDPHHRRLTSDQFREISLIKDDDFSIRDDLKENMEFYISEIKRFKLRENFFQEKEIMLTNMIYEISSQLVYQNYKIKEELGKKL